MNELPDVIFEAITALTDRGNALCDADDLVGAVGVYEAALSLVPAPQEEWNATTWILVALGDCHWLLGDSKQAVAYLSRAMHCPGAIGNCFIHLRLGQAQLDLGNEPRAKDELARAYMGGGPELFEGEDSRYLSFLRRFMLDI